MTQHFYVYPYPPSHSFATIDVQGVISGAGSPRSVSASLNSATEITSQLWAVTCRFGPHASLLKTGVFKRSMDAREEQYMAVKDALKANWKLQQRLQETLESLEKGINTNADEQAKVQTTALRVNRSGWYSGLQGNYLPLPRIARHSQAQQMESRCMTCNLAKSLMPRVLSKDFGPLAWILHYTRHKKSRSGVCTEYTSRSRSGEDFASQRKG